MAKRKLIKRGSASKKPIQRKTKRIPVEDKNGNKHILKATVIGMPTDKIRKERSSSIPDAPFQELGFGSKIIRPPLPQHELALLSEYSSDLGTNIEAYVTGVEGFGIKIEEREMTEAQKEQFAEQIRAEKRWIQTHLIDNPNPEGSLRSLRKELLNDREHTGNAYVELVPNMKGDKFVCYNRIEASNMWITKADKKFTRFVQQYVDENMQLKEKRFMKKFRRYVQVVGKNKVFYKEFRDPRPIDRRTGEVLRMRSNGEGKKVPVDKSGKEVKEKFLAREMFHFKIPTARKTPYGVPRYAGNIIAIKGSRSSEESNIITQQNNNVPSMAVMVSGGMLTEGSIQRLEEFVDTSIKGDMNYSKFLILEGEGEHDELSGTSSMKIDIKPLTNEQHTDALWAEYEEKNSGKVRRAFRHSPTMIGKTEEMSRDDAQQSERMAEKYIYNPAREEIDEDWNKMLVQQGIRFHIVKANSPNVTNDEDLVKILSGAEKTGGITPRIAHMILEDVLNRKLPPIKEGHPDFDPDLPFSISVGRLARGMARSNPEGTTAPRGQEEADRGVDNDPNSRDNQEAKTIVDVLHDSLDPQDRLQAEFLEQMEQVLDEKSFGRSRKDYFKHAC